MVAMASSFCDYLCAVCGKPTEPKERVLFYSKKHMLEKL